MPDVVLVSMPFGPVMSPSIALGLLKGVLSRHGASSRCLYFTIPFAEILGEEVYFGISDGLRPVLLKLAGEWIFNGALFDVSAQDEEEYVRTIIAPGPHATTDVDQMIADVLRARQSVDAFLDECVKTVLSCEPRIVGFTSTFQQQVASLALAKRLKQARPDLFILFGGANCEGPMGAEVVRQFECVDAAVSGEGEHVLPQIVDRVLQGLTVDGLPGVRTRGTIQQLTNTVVIENLDELPHPDYSDYFEQFGASRFGDEWQPSIFYETSRGCWWGERMHCTFCGLNGATMKYRSKSAPRAMEELIALTTAHPECDVEVTDNILDLDYFNTFLPQLAEKKLGVSLFYETKSNLRRDQVRLLRDAGVHVIQPGIESLSDSILKLMRKGVSALQNIQLLKWARELGVHVRWNIICGFPNEDPAEYARMAEIVPFLTHFTPPAVCTKLRLDRFSPNFFDSEKLGFTNVRPIPAFAGLYQVPPEAVANLAYYFSFEYQDPRDIDEYIGPLKESVQRWKKENADSALLAIDCGESIIVWDLRPIASKKLTILSGMQCDLFRACDAVADLRQLAAGMAARGYGEVTTEDIVLHLQPLVDCGFFLRDGNRYLALPITLGEYQPDSAITSRLQTVVSTLGSRSDEGFVISLQPGCEASSTDEMPSFLQRNDFLSMATFTVRGDRVIIVEGKE